MRYRYVTWFMILGTIFLSLLTQAKQCSGYAELCLFGGPVFGSGMKHYLMKRLKREILTSIGTLVVLSIQSRNPGHFYFEFNPGTQNIPPIPIMQFSNASINIDNIFAVMCYMLAK
jgi:hypothetical protein